MSGTLIATPLPHHVVSTERAALSQTLLASTSQTFLMVAVVRISNVHSSPVSFKVQTTEQMTTKFHVSPQSGTMKALSTITIAVAYCGGDSSTTPAQLAAVQFQLCSWDTKDPTGSKEKIRFALDFGEVTAADVATPTSKKETDINVGLRQRVGAGSGRTPESRRQEQEQEQERNTTTTTASSVQRLQQNSSTIVTKCTSIWMQLFLFGCMLYLYIFAYPQMTGSVADVLAFKTAVLPAFLLGVLAEKLRRRCV